MDRPQELREWYIMMIISFLRKDLEDPKDKSVSLLIGTEEYVSIIDMYFVNIFSSPSIYKKYKNQLYF